MSPLLFFACGKLNKCLMIANDTKFNPAPWSVRQTCRKILPALFLKNARGAHTPHTDLFAGAVMEAVSDQKLKD